MVLDVDVFGAQRSNPSKSVSISSMVLMLTPDSQTFPKISSLVCGSLPYREGESKAVLSRLNGWPSDRKWNLLFVLSALPSPANIRKGISSSRLNGKTPAVKGNIPGTFSERIHSIFPPQSSVSGRATRGSSRPLRVSVVVSTGNSFSLTV